MTARLPGLFRHGGLLAATAAVLASYGAAAEEPDPFRFSTSQEPPMGVDGGISAGVAVGDVDGDGWADVYIANWGGQPSRLYLVRPGRKVQTAADNDATNGTAWASGPLLCDFDNDGYPDLFVAHQRNRHNALFWNREGTLARETRGDVVSDFGDSYSASCGDMDGDGLLDLVVGNSGQPVFLYRNEGEGRFTRLESLTSRTLSLNVWAPLLFDINGDGFPDVLAAGNSENPDAAYPGDGEGGFGAPIQAFPDADPSSTVSHALADVDNDGDLDVLVIKSNGFFADAKRRLFRNEDGVYTFDPDDELSKVESPASGAAFVDIDNDGDLDAYVSQYGVRDSLFVNDGNGSFRETAKPRLFAFAYFTSGHGWHDLDHDGRQDLVVANWEGLNNFIFWNESPAGHWLQVELQGIDSNRAGVGAVVWAEATIEGRRVRQRRDVVAGHSFRSQTAPEAAFGLGDATVVDRLRIEWPSGRQTELADVPADRRLRIAEDGEMTVLWEAAAASAPSLVDRMGQRYLDGPPQNLESLLAEAGGADPEGLRSLALYAARADRAAHALAAGRLLLRRHPASVDAWRLQLAIARFFNASEAYADTMKRLEPAVGDLEGPDEQIEVLRNELGYWRKLGRGIGR